MEILEETQCVLDVNTDIIMTCYFYPQLVMGILNLLRMGRRMKL